MLRPRHGLLLLALGIWILGCQPQTIIPIDTVPSASTKTPKPTVSGSANPNTSPDPGDNIGSSSPTPTPFTGAGIISFIQLPFEGGPSPLNAISLNYCLYIPSATDSEWPESFTYNYNATASDGSYYFARALRPELLQRSYQAYVDMSNGTAPLPITVTVGMAEPTISPVTLTVPAMGAAPLTVPLPDAFIQQCPDLAGTTITTQTETEEADDGLRPNGVKLTINCANASTSADVFRQLAFTAFGENLATASMRLTITNMGYLPILIQ